MPLTESLLFWTLLAVLAFWSVGAYNRLVRLRAEANAAFAQLEAELARQVQLVRDCAAVGAGEAPAAFWDGLQGAAGQFAASLQSARARPLDVERIAALGAAQDVLAHAWERAEREDAHNLSGPQLPEGAIEERLRRVRAADSALEAFNQAVQAYNEAIGQFPASLLAWIFGFRPGRGLRGRGG